MSQRDQKHQELELRTKEHNDQLAQRDQDHADTKSSLEQQHKKELLSQ